MEPEGQVRRMSMFLIAAALVTMGLDFVYWLWSWQQEISFVFYIGNKGCELYLLALAFNFILTLTLSRICFLLVWQ